MLKPAIAVAALVFSLARAASNPNLPTTSGGATFVFQSRSGSTQADGLRPLLQPQSSRQTQFAVQAPRGNRGNFTRKTKKAVDTNGVKQEDYGNGKKLSQGKETHVVHDPVGSGWLLFHFGTVQEEANPSFALKSKDYIRVRITDMYYNGDRFAVYNVYNDIKPELVMETPQVDCDSTKNRITDPTAAFKSVGVWSHGEVVLAPGKYHLVIKPLSSPFGGGTGAIHFARVAELANVPVGLVAGTSDAEVCSGYGDYVVVRQRVTSEHQAAVCQLLGLVSADVNTSDQEDVKALTQTVYRCVGRERVVWINSCDGDTEQGRLAVRITNDSMLQVEKRNAAEKHHVLCAVKTD